MLGQPAGADSPLCRLSNNQSQASLQSSSISTWNNEHVPDTGIRLPPGTPTQRVAVLDLHPTQLAVGMQQVHEKMEKVASKQQKGPEALDKFLQNHPVPVVLGPNHSPYLIDHHHLCLALQMMGIPQCYAGVVRDYSQLNPEQFWAAMAFHNYLWPYDANGNPVDIHELPKLLPHTVKGLVDDPYRSLAALVRKAGGYTKSTKPFSEVSYAYGAASSA
eukprot:GHRR01017292.1.p1 GENE.GHRR01017292.1~~GHRR01017292.1.p1  ORF type:complete len:218 (+),score=61.99 GHRR01017292.1:141-794(+)